MGDTKVRKPLAEALRPGDRTAHGAEIIVVVANPHYNDEVFVLWAQTYRRHEMMTEYGVHRAWYTSDGSIAYESGNYFPARDRAEEPFQFLKAVEKLQERASIKLDKTVDVLDNGAWTKEEFDPERHYRCGSCSADMAEDVYHLFD